MEPALEPPAASGGEAYPGRGSPKPFADAAASRGACGVRERAAADPLHLARIDAKTAPRSCKRPRSDGFTQRVHYVPDRTECPAEDVRQRAGCHQSAGGTPRVSFSRYGRWSRRAVPTSVPTCYIVTNRNCDQLQAAFCFHFMVVGEKAIRFFGFEIANGPSGGKSPGQNRGNKLPLRP